MKATKQGSIGAVCLWLCACVTINIYFPAEAAQEEIHQYIEKIYGDEPAVPSAQPKSPQSALSLPDLAQRSVLFMLQAVVPPAYAGADFSMDFPTVRRIQESQIQRAPSLRPYLDSGAIGFSNGALLAEKDMRAVPREERNTLKKLVADENRDSNALYREIARANGQPNWETKIRAAFEKEMRAKAQQNGWFVQDAQGNWSK